MTEKKLNANRANARKSTGPKTSFGKAASSRNAVKHGLLAAAPILPGIESGKAWAKHRNGVLASLAPVGYLEELLATRLATLSWRLFRVVQYEAEVSAAAVARAEADLEERDENRHRVPSELAATRADAQHESLAIELLTALPELPSVNRLHRKYALPALWAIWWELKTPEDSERISVPGIPDEWDEIVRFDNWTVGLLREAVKVYAAATGTTPEALLKGSISSARIRSDQYELNEHRREEKSQRWQLLLEQEYRRRMLLDPDVLDKVVRYESSLERAFFRTLHEIQRLQASRSGVMVPPPAAVDVDVSIHPEGSS